MLLSGTASSSSSSPSRPGPFRAAPSRGRLPAARSLQLRSAPAGGSAAGLLSMVLKIRPDLSEVLKAPGCWAQSAAAVTPPRTLPSSCGAGPWPWSSRRVAVNVRVEPEPCERRGRGGQEGKALCLTKSTKLRCCRCCAGPLQASGWAGTGTGGRTPGARGLNKAVWVASVKRARL